ncbi:sulfotransferase [Chlorella sorokiniana]|uniref:Sulfotransferase n=1 Tax=Chlorella sorokiniana TaxID=3076 RepID=A0A2P6TKH7_CHLSO|nr:sulfotransferase [Chlorella sorokiniana]|eukprot:PRW44571.1 sulfotransferase [Chlorella sorokiniana]
MCRPPIGGHGKRPFTTVVPSLLGLAAAAMLTMLIATTNSSSSMMGLCKSAGCMGGLNSKERQLPPLPSPNPAMLPSGRLELLHGCTDFRCLRAAHALPRGPGQAFNFPHFFVIGFPKCATTSLAAYLQRHPQAVESNPKEPRMFNAVGNCSHPDSPTLRWGCDKAQEERYLLRTLKRDVVVESGLSRAAFEASTDYSWTPHVVASGIRRELPWLKLVVSIREPISTAISGVVHRLQELGRPKEEQSDWWVPEPVDECLERMRGGTNGTSMADCLRIRLGGDKSAWFDYTRAMAGWLHAFPAEQFHVLQYENLTAPGSREAVLADMQRFLGLDPSLAPRELPAENSRKGSEHPEGWPMRREQYEEFVGIATAASHRLAEQLEQHGLKDGEQWLEAWEAAWSCNLASCDANGDCLIQLT